MTRYYMYVSCLVLCASCLFYSCTNNTSDNKVSDAFDDTIEAPKDNVEVVTDGKTLTKEQVIKVAEAWVASQGYTEQEVDLTKQQLTFEKGEYASDTAKILKTRHNSLNGNALGARKYNLNRWAVGFVPIPKENNIVRALTMDSIGANITMQTVDVRADWILEQIK